MTNNASQNGQFCLVRSKRNGKKYDRATITGMVSRCISVCRYTENISTKTSLRDLNVKKRRTAITVDMNQSARQSRWNFFKLRKKVKQRWRWPPKNISFFEHGRVSHWLIRWPLHRIGTLYSIFTFVRAQVLPPQRPSREWPIHKASQLVRLSV